MSVLMKTLLVHGAKQDDVGKQHIEQALKDARNTHQFKRAITRPWLWNRGYRACADPAPPSEQPS